MLLWIRIHSFLDSDLRDECLPIVQARLELNSSGVEFVGDEVPRESSRSESFKGGLEQVWRVLEGFGLR